MISPEAKSEWQKWTERLETSEINKDSTRPKSIHNVQDTVGAVVWTADGGMAAGVSRRVFREVWPSGVLTGKKWWIIAKIPGAYWRGLWNFFSFSIFSTNFFLHQGRRLRSRLLGSAEFR